MILLARGRFGPTAARVLEPLRVHGPASREQLATASGLSVATVARTVAVLVEEGLVRERQDLVAAGTVGRPPVPVEVDPTHYAVLGAHVGRLATTVALVDLAGRPVAQVRVATPVADPSGAAPDAVVAAICRHASALVRRHPQRTVLSAGVVAPWFDVGLSQEEVRRRLELATGLPVAAGEHVAAVAAAEYVARGSNLPGCTMYLYVRDTAGFALAEDQQLRTEISRVGRLAHFPTGSRVLCHCGATGCLEATASDEALAQEALDRGIVEAADIDSVRVAARAGNLAAHGLLLERARILGRTAAIVRDMVAPDRLVLVGQAFTGYPQALGAVRTALLDATTLGPVDLTFTRFGAGVQAVASGAVALGPVYEDPLGLVRGEVLQVGSPVTSS